MNKKTIILTLFECMFTKDFKPVEPFLSDEISLDFPGLDLAQGKKRVLLVLNVILRNYNNLTFEVSDIIIEEDKAVAVWTNKGVSKQGEDYSNSGMTLIEFENDKIVFLSDYFKDTSFTK